MSDPRIEQASALITEWLAGDLPVHRRARQMLAVHGDPVQLRDWITSVMYASNDTQYRVLWREMTGGTGRTDAMASRWKAMRDVARKVPRWTVSQVPAQVFAAAIDPDNELGWREPSAPVEVP